MSVHLLAAAASARLGVEVGVVVSDPEFAVPYLKLDPVEVRVLLWIR
jgi:hypothetical protein